MESHGLQLFHFKELRAGHYGVPWTRGQDARSMWMRCVPKSCDDLFGWKLGKWQLDEIAP